MRLDQELEQWAWKEICATELSLSSSSRLHPTGSTPGAGSSSSQLRSSSLRWDWRRAFYDLDLSRLNELRATSQDYEFLPSLYGEPACAPEGVSFATRGGRTVDCSLNPRYLGRDRCLLARWPLSAALAATAVAKGPGDAVAYRRVGYYEVTIGNENEHEAVLPCISVGLCSPRFSRYAVARQQAGWDSESWALHSDDGLLFHASNRGYPFDSLSGCATSFGPSDTLGCGIYQAPEEGSAGLEEVAKAPRKIFYTLNGTLLGFAFDLDLPADVPLWPCVGLDTKQWLSFNFGSEPFKFDLDELSPLEVTLKTPFDSLDFTPADPVQGASGKLNEVREETAKSTARCWRPLVSKLIPRHWMNVTGPAEEVVRRYQSQPRWLDAVDRLVNATLLDATGETAPQMVHRGFDEFFPMPQLH